MTTKIDALLSGELPNLPEDETEVPEYAPVVTDADKSMLSAIGIRHD